jgi:hypothetical protein
MHCISLLKQLVVVLAFLLLSCGNTLKEKETLNTIHSTYTSTFVKDSFDIYITLPVNYDSSSQTFPVVFYMDANLKSGKKLRSIANEFANNHQPINAVFVGVGHTGPYRTLRRRDFISPSITDSSWQTQIKTMATQIIFMNF